MSRCHDALRQRDERHRGPRADRARQRHRAPRWGLAVSRATRRRDLADFRRKIGTHLDVYTIDVNARLTTPLLSNARAHWFAQVTVRKPCCISCRRLFTHGALAHHLRASSIAADDVRPGLFVLAVPSSTPTSCSTSAICRACSNDLSPGALDACVT